eukprot:TRINITY_DN27610_c0_g1_i1.p1 TRINITY_DN27610_c0_g1~~TRINITY_DN27610_c0_g1_i1.p1  ORF type:complete len:307 (+),score=44.16 TRINITY_DN27610_c0_g1_i1:22-921(+)
MDQLASFLLNHILGDYVEGLDAKKLHFGSQEIELNDLSFKKTALSKLRLPIELKKGVIGSIQLCLPGLAITTKPAKIYIKRVFILAGPSSSDCSGLTETKKNLLDLYDLVSLRQVDSTPTDVSWMDQTFSRILENLHISISDIHIRYEDNISSSIPFSAGITLDSVQLHSCGADWEVLTDFSSNKDNMYKIVSLNSLALYLNTSKILASPLTWCDLTEFATQMSEMIPTRANLSNFKHNFVLEPVSGTVKVTTEKVKDFTKYIFQALIEEITLNFDSLQFSCFFEVWYWSRNYLSRTLR